MPIVCVLELSAEKRRQIRDRSFNAQPTTHTSTRCVYFVSWHYRLKREGDIYLTFNAQVDHADGHVRAKKRVPDNKYLMTKTHAHHTHNLLGVTRLSPKRRRRKQHLLEMRKTKENNSLLNIYQIQN